MNDILLPLSLKTTGPVPRQDPSTVCGKRSMMLKVEQGEIRSKVHPDGLPAISQKSSHYVLLVPRAMTYE